MPELELTVSQCLERRQPPIIQPRRKGTDEAVVRKVRQNLTPPQRKAAFQLSCRNVRHTGGEQPLTLLDCSFEYRHVQRLAGEDKPVAAVLGDYYPGPHASKPIRFENFAQVKHISVDRCDEAAWSAIAPQHVGKLFQ